MVGPIDVKQIGIASVECLVNYVTLTFGLIHDLGLRFFNFEIAVSQELLV